MQEGKYVGKLIKARLDGDEKIAPFEYFDKGSMATIGHRAAVADAFGMKFTGMLGYTMWGFIHVLYLIGWGNRLGTLYTWARALTFSNNRGHRIITFEQAHDQSRELVRKPERAQCRRRSRSGPRSRRSGPPRTRRPSARASVSATVRPGRDDCAALTPCRVPRCARDTRCNPLCIRHRPHRRCRHGRATRSASGSTGTR